MDDYLETKKKKKQPEIALQLIVNFREHKLQSHFGKANCDKARGFA